MNSNDNWALRRLGLFALVLVGGWLTVFAYALHAALPFNPIRLPFEVRAKVRLLIPEGWAFFTRDPRKENMLLFTRHSDGTWVSALLGPNATPSNDFGLNRASRAQGVETALLMHEFPDSSFRDCRILPTDCLETTQLTNSINDASPNPSICGDIGFVMQKPVPWAWWASGQAIVMPSRVARIKVDCQ